MKGPELLRPLVSVIVPVYNAERWLSGTFRSFDAQDYPLIEWVLVDDGSADGSLDQLKLWKPRSGNKTIVSKANGGASSARNVGLDRARGDYVLFWDSDDEQSPDAISKMVAAAAGAEVSVCAIRKVEATGAVRDLFTCKPSMVSSVSAVSRWLREEVSTGPYSKLILRELLLDNQIRFEEGVINEDVMWTAKVFAAANKVMLMGEPLYRYIARPGSVTTKVGMASAAVFDNCNKLDDYISVRFPELREDTKRYCARAVWSVALASARGGNKKNCPSLYELARKEYWARRKDIVSCCTGWKNVVMRVLFETGLYGVVRR